MVSCKNFLLIILVVLLSHIVNAKLLLKDILASQNSSPYAYETIDDIEVFKKENPDVEFKELNMIRNVEKRIVYTFGARTPGDQLVAHGAKNLTWRTPQNATITLNYPSSGQGALLTYVYAAVNQSSNIGSASVSKGGIHQRFITLEIEGYGVTFMNVEVKLYGIV